MSLLAHLLFDKPFPVPRARRHLLDDPEPKPKPKKEERRDPIIEILAVAKLATHQEIARILGRKPENVSRRLRNLRDREIVINTNGKWRLK